jgi:hypothetical protein
VLSHSSWLFILFKINVFILNKHFYIAFVFNFCVLDDVTPTDLSQKQLEKNVQHGGHRT